MQNLNSIQRMIMEEKNKNKLYSLIELVIEQTLDESESICLDSSMDKEHLKIKLENQVKSALNQFEINEK